MQVIQLFGVPEWVEGDILRQRRGTLVDDGFEILMGKGTTRISLGCSSIAAAETWRWA